MPPEFIKESNLWGPLFALGVFGVLVLVAVIVQVVFQIVLRRRATTAPESLDTQIVATIRGPVVLFIIVLGVFLAFIVLTGLTSPVFDVLDEGDEWGRKLWVVVVIGEVTYLASRLTQVVIGWYIRTIASRTTSKLDDRLLPPLKRVLPMATYALGALVAMGTLDISISPLLAGIGIGGLAVALAVQPTLGNFFAGTQLVAEGELRAGDFIEIEGGPAGYVVDVGWRSTKIRSRYNNTVIVPNSKMVDSIVTNYFGPTPAMNVNVTCGVSYDSDLGHVEGVVMEVMGQVIAESPYAVKDVAPFFGFSEFGDSNIDFWIFVQANDRNGSFVLTSDIIKGIHGRFKQEGIEINYPVRKLVPPMSDGHLPVIDPREAHAEQTSSADEGA